PGTDGAGRERLPATPTPAATRSSRVARLRRGAARIVRVKEVGITLISDCDCWRIVAASWPDAFPRKRSTSCRICHRFHGVRPDLQTEIPAFAGMTRWQSSNGPGEG